MTKKNYVNFRLDEDLKDFLIEEGKKYNKQHSTDLSWTDILRMIIRKHKEGKNVN